jgi:Arc/MetJ-type ribon-helix-helix transcriptional regulator
MGNQRVFIEKPKENMKIVTVNFSDEQQRLIKKLVKQGFFISFSEAIRHIVTVWEEEFLARLEDRERLLAKLDSDTFCESHQILKELIP